MNKYTRLKAACYTTNVTMAVVGNLPPLLFMIFRDTYNVSFTLLGLLVLVNFTTQLTVDFLFSLLSKQINIPFALKMTPMVSFVGLMIFALAPVMFPNNVYAGLALGSVVFAAASGIAEVLVSPTIASLPSDHPDKDMSLLHSIYAWGVVGVVLFSTAFMYVFGGAAWQYLTAILSLIPLTAFFLFLPCEVPQSLSSDESKESVLSLVKRGVVPFVLCIFAGGAAECIMSQWVSGYLERGVGIPKQYGDVFGVAMFALFLGLGRTLYSKFGKKIERVLKLGFFAAALCYVTACVSDNAIVGVCACALTGFCTSMLWPGSLIHVSDTLTGCGVTVYALMAAGGDLGAAIGPQLVGIVTDTVVASEKCIEIANKFGLTPEALGMKAGLLLATLFCIFGFVTVLLIKKRFKRKEA